MIYIAFFLLLFSFSGFSLDLNSILSGVEQGTLHSVEELISSLPASSLQDPIVIYKSRSLQGATPENPRVILSSPEGVYLTFNGSSDQKRGDHIEILRRATPTQKAAFYSIDFSASPPTVEKDPRLCFTCHTSFGHPLFDPADLWPGVFGGYPGNKNEKEQLAQFLDLKGSHPRYRHLAFSASSFDSFSERNRRFTRSLYHFQAGELARLFQNPDPAWLEPSPGNAFTELVGPQNREKAKEIYASAVPYICKRILLSTIRQLRSQPNPPLSYAFQDLRVVDGIARAYTLASLSGRLDAFKDLSTPTLDRESYVSYDGGAGFWTYFYDALARSNRGVWRFLSGDSAILNYSPTGYSLSRPHSLCGRMTERAPH